MNLARGLVAFITLALACGLSRASPEGFNYGNDLFASGRLIGSVPLRPAQEVEFEITVRNPGPTTAQGFIAQAYWRYDEATLALVDRPGGCQTFWGQDAGDPPIFYGLGVYTPQAIPPGASVTCRFAMVVSPLPSIPRELASGASITFEAWEGPFFGSFLDPDFTDNRVTFGIGPAVPPQPVPGMSSLAAVALLVGLMAIGARFELRRRVRRAFAA